MFLTTGSIRFFIWRRFVLSGLVVVRAITRTPLKLTSPFNLKELTRIHRARMASIASFTRMGARRLTSVAARTAPRATVMQVPSLCTFSVRVCQDLRTEPWPCSLLGIAIACTMRTFAARYLQPSCNARSSRVPLSVVQFLCVPVRSHSTSVYCWKRRFVFGSPCTPLLLLPVPFPKDSKECLVSTNS